VVAGVSPRRVDARHREARSERIVTRDGKIGNEIEGVPKVVFGGDAGLLDVALDPAFASNRLIYFTYVEPRQGGNGVALAKARLADDRRRLEDLTVILRVEPTVRGNAHFGSRLLFDKEGKLFISLSELDGNHVVGEERLLLDQRQRMRDVRQGPDGSLWVVTDNRDGRLIRIAPRDQ
jgi:aldose sugar dehydrogenase